MEIPWKELDQITLERLLSEVVTRDGTDYGLQETSTGAKIKAVIRGLESGSVGLFWDDESETASLITREQAREDKRIEDKLRRESGITST